MRNLKLSIAAGVLGLFAASSAAQAFTTYEVSAAQGANLMGSSSHESDKPLFSVETNTTGWDAFGNPRQGNRNSMNSQEAPSRDMGWQGTGYYLRPDK